MSATVGHDSGKHDDARDGDRDSCAWCPQEEPKTVIGLECVDCGLVVFSIEAAADHESDESDEHGGWDTITLTVTP